MTQGTTQPFEEYYAALERLKAGRPKVVPKGSRITKDAVSVEAGRGKGSINKSRGVFAALIDAIARAAAEQSRPTFEQKQRLAKSRGMAEQYRRDLEAALVREVSSLKELYEVRKSLAKLTGDKIIPIRGQTDNCVGNMRQESY